MRRLCCWVLLLSVASVAKSQEGIVFSRPPGQSGGWPSDTAYPFGGVSSNSQRLADDFTIDAAATVRRITWWGDYWGVDPPANEAMRIRVYAAEGSSGLPGDALYDATIVNVPRAPTGLLVPGLPWTSREFPEYLFQANLPAPILLNANAPYWLEITQIGHSSSPFVWEFSAAGLNGFVFANPADAQWKPTSDGSGLAFQLSTIPEPATLALTLLPGILVRRRGTLWKR